MNTENNKIMVFGVFDNLHDGHRFFLENALKHGSELYISVTPTHTVEKLKGRLPFYSIKERIHSLEIEYPNARIIEGDTNPNLWTPIIQYRPDIVVCGYDQDELYNALEKIEEKFNFKLVKVEENHNGAELHSRIINKSV